MIDTIYFEKQVETHPRAERFFKRFPEATRINCDHYKEVFNPSGQNFRLQKKKPSIILAKQSGNLLHQIPPSYGIGGDRNFYFSHLLNCPYDCRYCFLQGMYSSAHFVLFVNYEDFWKDIKTMANASSSSPTWFFAGYDCDCLALESITGFVDFFLPRFAEHSTAHLELRTKSVNVQILESKTPVNNIVVAFSFTPHEISLQLEKGVPGVAARIKAMHKLAKLGWNVGIRIDPIIDCEDFEVRYSNLIDDLFCGLPEERLHSVSMGAFRMPSNFFRKIEKLYPHEPLFAGRLKRTQSSVSYNPEIENLRLQTCRELILKKITKEKLFECSLSP